MRQKIEKSRGFRLLLLVGGYVAVLSAAFYLSYDLRFDFSVPVESQIGRNHFLPLVVLVQLGLLALFRQFGSLLTYFSVPDLVRIVAALVASSVVFTVAWYVSSGSAAPHRGVILTDFVLAVAGLSSFRLVLRVYRERFSTDRTANGDSQIKTRRIVIFGAGDVGARLAQEAASKPKLGLKPVCFLDDDQSKYHQLIHGIPVNGAPELVVALAAEQKLDSAVIAMPTASGRRLREIVTLATQAKLKVEIVPSFAELTTGRVQVSRIRPVEVVDLLGREPVPLDSARIVELVKDRVVMVTGAGGSIGSELCRQIASLNPKRLLMVEQAEGSLFQIEQELNEAGLGSIALPLVADILNSPRMEYIFARFNPSVVFHAAAHKHVYMMERQPAEALQNNSMGTRLLAQLAAKHGLETFVFISTDKAINPTSVMGATKRLAEIHLQAIASAQRAGKPEGRKAGGPEDQKGSLPALTNNPEPITNNPAAKKPTKFIAVRFGNVLGSSGSVVPIFKRQIANGGPVTVTHPDVTRYFMTIPEAVGLVLQASVLGTGGEIFVLDMGQPVKIVDLARQMIELSGLRVGEDIEIKFTGLKPGEKLYEELQHRSEGYAPTEHPRITRLVSSVNVQSVSATAVAGLENGLYGMEGNEIKKRLQSAVPEYVPFLD